MSSVTMDVRADTGGARWFSANPDKAWVEKFFLLYSPVWMASMAMMMFTGWDKTWGDGALLLHGPKQVVTSVTRLSASWMKL